MARFNPGTTERRARRVAFGSVNSKAGLVPTWAGSDLSNDSLAQAEFAAHAIELLGVDVPLHAMHASAMPLFLGPMTAAEIKFFSYRIAANAKPLSIEMPMPPWSGLHRPTLAPLQIVNAYAGWSRGKKPRHGTILTFRVIDGEACPLQFSRWFPQKFLWVLARELRISAPRAKHPFRGKRAQLYGIRLQATLVNSEYTEGAITFERFTVGQFTGYNKALMRLRDEPCPNRYAWPCHKCTLGEDNCPVAGRACREKTLLLSSCPVCNQQTYHEDSRCVVCRSRQPAVNTGV